MTVGEHLGSRQRPGFAYDIVEDSLSPHHGDCVERTIRRRQRCRSRDRRHAGMGERLGVSGPAHYLTGRKDCHRQSHMDFGFMALFKYA